MTTASTASRNGTLAPRSHDCVRGRVLLPGRARLQSLPLLVRLAAAAVHHARHVRRDAVDAAVGHPHAARAALICQLAIAYGFSRVNILSR